MKKGILRLIQYVLILIFISYIYQVFWPKTYAVPELKIRAGTSYWNLSTGSRIGYTHVLATGYKNKYPIIYLHGGPGGSVSDRDIKDLSVISKDGYDVYLYDQIGSGLSSRLENITDYTVTRHLNDLREIIRQIGAERVILIGQSWGAILAVLFTAENAELVDKIIFTSPGPIYPIRQELKNINPPDSLHLKAPYFSNDQGVQKAYNLRTKLMRFWAEKFHFKLASDKEADDFATYLNYEVNKSTVCDTSNILNPRAGSGFYAGIMTFNSLKEFQNPRVKLLGSKIPILVIKGQCDNQKWGYTNEYLELFQNHQFSYIPNAGHFISVEQPELYIKSIREFLRNKYQF